MSTFASSQHLVKCALTFIHAVITTTDKGFATNQDWEDGSSCTKEGEKQETTGIVGAGYSGSHEREMTLLGPGLGT